MQKVIFGSKILGLVSPRFFSTSTNLLKNSNDPPLDMVDIEDRSVPIPNYAQKIGESLELQKARLVYQSRKRGMLENGLLLSTFAAKYLEGMTTEQTQLYDTLINQPTNDWDIFYWATNVKPTPDEYNTEMMDLLKKHVSNKSKETRFRQPDLYQQAM